MNKDIKAAALSYDIENNRVDDGCGGETFQRI